MKMTLTQKIEVLMYEARQHGDLVKAALLMFICLREIIERGAPNSDGGPAWQHSCVTA